MPRFTVRIELGDHDGNDGKELLDRAMERQGFTRVVQRRDGRRFHLPPAEYRMLGRRTHAQVCRLAQAGVAAVADRAAILVTEGRCTWHNLRGVAS